MAERQCLIRGRPLTCRYVDPRRAQGAHWWATSDPGGGAVASGMAPLSAPSYVVKRNGFEERHWLAENTGYRVDLATRRRLGFNARPMDGQPRSGLQWFGASNLCDPARPEMGCAPPPAAKRRPSHRPRAGHRRPVRRHPAARSRQSGSTGAVNNCYSEPRAHRRPNQDPQRYRI